MLYFFVISATILHNKLHLKLTCDETDVSGRTENILHHPSELSETR